MRLIVLLLVTVLFGSPAGESAEKEAVAQVKAAAKLHLKAFKDSGKAALTTLDANLKSAEALLSETSEPEETAELMAARAIVFMNALTEAYESAAGLVDSAASVALLALEDGGDLQGLYPEALYYGNDGLLDDFRADLLQAGEKVMKSARKRIAKFAKLAEKEAGIALTFHIFFPHSREGRMVNPGELTGFGQEPRLDVVVAGSALDTADDGHLVISGVTDSDSDPVALGFSGPEGSSDSDSSGVDADNRFLVVFGPALPEGGYAVWADQGTGTLDDSAGIGIR
jgi:hypothetical protein